VLKSNQFQLTQFHCGLLAKEFTNMRYGVCSHIPSTTVTRVRVFTLVYNLPVVFL